MPKKKTHTNAQHWNQLDPEFYGILWATGQIVMNDKATYMWLSGQV
jgi:hypothetical protein